MKITTYLSLSLLFTASCFSVFGQCADPTNVHSFNYNGTNYDLVRENVSWADAAACAVNQGGHLAEINDANENVALFAELITNAGITFSNTVAPDGGGGSYIWLGGNDLATEGTWIWDGDNTGASVQFWQGTASGSPVGGLYSNWGNEPDDFGGQDGLGLSLNGWPLGSSGEWNDVDETNQLYFLIEYPASSDVNELEKNIEISPNPFDDKLRITTNDGIQEIIVSNSLGQEMKRMEAENSMAVEINTNDLTSDLYFVTLIFTDGSTVIQKLVK